MQEWLDNIFILPASASWIHFVKWWSKPLFWLLSREGFDEIHEVRRKARGKRKKEREKPRVRRAWTYRLVVCSCVLCPNTWGNLTSLGDWCVPAYISHEVIFSSCCLVATSKAKRSKRRICFNPDTLLGGTMRVLISNGVLGLVSLWYVMMNKTGRCML